MMWAISAGVAVRVGGRQVDLVEHRDDRQVAVQRQVQVGQRLRLDALGGVDQQHRALAGLQRPGHLVGEVDVAGRVDQVQDELLVRHTPGQPHVLGLDGDTALTLDIHPVQVLRAHRPFVDDTGELQHPVGQRRLAVVDVGDDAEVSNLRRRGEGLVGEAADGNLLVRCAGCAFGASSVSTDRLRDTIARAHRHICFEHGVAVEDVSAVRGELGVQRGTEVHPPATEAETLRIQQGIKVGHGRDHRHRQRRARGNHGGPSGDQQQRSHRATGPQAGVRTRSRRPRRSRRNRVDLGGLRGRPVTREGPSGAGGGPRPPAPCSA